MDTKDANQFLSEVRSGKIMFRRQNKSSKTRTNNLLKEAAG